MKHFETVYKELEDLLIRKLPEYIEKTNKKYNDNLILKSFENTSLEENCIKQPCFKITFISGEYSEKDRIIENEVYNAAFEIKLPENQKYKVATFWRYVESIRNLFDEEETTYNYEIPDWKDTTIKICVWCRN